VFGDLCRNSEGSLLKHCILRLQHSYRFAQVTGISQLADAVNNGDSEIALQLLDSQQFPEVTRIASEMALLDQSLIQHLSQRFETNTEPLQRLQANNQFQLLCAHRKGRWGVEELNQSIENLLRNHTLVSGHGPYYHGKPIIISRNNYQLNLFNGDIGVLTHSQSGELKAYFSTSDNGIRELSPARLPTNLTAWALTVHQSQGSEFDHVLLVLPEELSPVLNRELIYTAITRARKSICIMGSRNVLEQAITARTNRQSGIWDKLSIDFNGEK
jgi:exodeoxyribonuclease V alpha subunit